MDLNEQSDRDFSRARRRAFLKRVGAYLRKDPASNQLLSFDEVRSALGAAEHADLRTRRARARRRPVAQRVGAYLRKDPASNQLLSFDEVRSALGAVEQAYLGMRVVPVAKIVGSVGRHRDFDRAFLPSKPSLGGRWKKIDQAILRAEELPPVSLYKLGDAYFVRDGNHRVSVARQQGTEMI